MNSSILRLILFLLFVCAASVARASTIEETTFAGFPAFRLSDGKTEAVVVPFLAGRVMRFGAVGGANWLWNAPEEKRALDGYINWGGDKTFAGPHGTWSAFAPTLWPPEPTWDGPYSVVGTGSETGDALHRLVLKSGVWRGFGVVIERSFGWNESGEFVVTQRIEKVAGEPRLLSVWQVAQIAPPDAVFLPLSPRSAYAKGFHAFGALPVSSDVATALPTLLRVRPTAKKGYKLGADSPVAAIAAVKDGAALVLRAAKPKGDYPDGAEGAGFPVEFYNHGASGAEQYVEIELLSPLRRFVRGGGWTHSVRWSLHPLSSKDVDSVAVQTEIDQLLNQ